MFTNNTSSRSDLLTSTLFAGTAGVLIAVATVDLGIAALRSNSYGAWLFVLTPFVMGVVTARLYNHRRRATAGETGRLVFATLLVAGSFLLLLGLEGAICLMMALPLALPLALLGGLAGRAAAEARTRRAPPTLLLLLAIPVTATLEPPSGHTLYEVRSSVVIDAPPDTVWPHVVAFSEITEPADWIFRAGVAYPIRARIEGTGVGAVRYCEFSTGAFVEPITRWEPGQRLSFDVDEFPVPMRELSPYPDLSPRHLHGYFRSKRGEFRFVDLGDGRTRLEGSTWYEIEMAPETYWRLLSDALIHRIHHRVLDHIKREVEAS